jgi:hypothetical protein
MLAAAGHNCHLLVKWLELLLCLDSRRLKKQRAPLQCLESKTSRMTCYGPASYARVSIRNPSTGLLAEVGPESDVAVWFSTVNRERI